LNKPPTHNYAKFTQILTDEYYKIDFFKRSLLEFVLNYSKPFRKINTTVLEDEWLINYQTFNFHFQHLYELNYYYRYGYNNLQFLDKLADTCKNIQNLKIHIGIDHSLIKLIKEQKNFISKFELSEKF